MARDSRDQLYAGISGVSLGIETFDLGRGVHLQRTYAHLFSPYLVAFAPRGPEGYHLGPLSPAEGGIGFDVHVQLTVPQTTSLGANSDASDIVWWIAALLRASHFPFLAVPVLSDHPFADIPALPGKARLRPFEVKPRIVGPAKESAAVLTAELLEWVKGRWLRAGRLVHAHRKFRSAFKALDAATVDGRKDSSLLAMWGGLEQLFGSGRNRIAAFIAAFLHPPGADRLATYRRVQKLYVARSAAAHTADHGGVEPLLETYVLMRNALIKMVDEVRVPTQADLEELVFGGSEKPPNT